jgi:site-specific DNA recombinase
MTDTQLKAAIYIRVSSDEQIAGTSLDTQRERCLAFCEAMQWVVTEVYSDEGVSGAKSSRPALDRLMAACRSGAVNSVVVLHLDRFSRSRAHLFTALDELASEGVAFTSVTQAFDTSTTSGDGMVGMLGVFAQMERKMIRDRTRTGVNKRVRGGGWGGGDKPPFGYKVVGKSALAHLEINDREAQVVREAVTLVVDRGLSTGEAANRLNALGLAPRTALLWTNQNLRNSLLRGQWDGRWTYGKVSPTGSVPEPIVVDVEPILGAEQAAALAVYLKRTRRVRSASGVHPLSGRLICLCGQSMTGIARSDRVNRRYRCSHGHQHPGMPGCHEPSVLADAVDDAVWQQVLMLLTDPDRLMALAQERLGMLQGAQVVEADALRDAERAVARTQDALAQGATRCITMGLDDATMEATLGKLREHHRQSVQHRAMVAAMSQETTAAKARMTTAQELAQVARERLLKADKGLRAKVFALLDVRATITENGDLVKVRLEGSVAHDLLLAGVRDDLAPRKLASTPPG